MTFPLLPPLKKDGGVADLRTGTWVEVGAVALNNIAKNLAVAKIDGKFIDIDSIPSMWARPLLFETALYDEAHPMHQCVVGEWRGLLAMLALKEWCDFPLTTEQLQITDTKDFLRALRKLLPKGALAPAATWETLNIILFNGKPIGITSPTTLVCTAVDCGRISGVPWFNKGFLDNPIPKLSNIQKEAVAGWLRRLSNDALGLPKGELKGSLAGLLNSFIIDLGGVPAVPISFSDTGLGLAQDLFKPMNNPVVPMDLPSSIELVPSPDKHLETILLVCDQTISEDWKVEPQNVVVWKSQTLATTQSFSGKPKLSLPTDVHLRSSQDFFTDQLFVINQDKAFDKDSTLVSKGSEALNFNGIYVTPILPITEELLTYLDVSDLNERITFDQQNDSIVVKLRLTLSGIDKQNRDFVISKEYDPANINSISTGPVLAIWPNFRTPDWKSYYTYFTTADQDTFYARPFLAAGERSESRTFSDSSKNVEKEITKTKRFPEAMLCEYKGVKAGILLLSVPEGNINIDGTEWHIGVDFGTSSTTVYYRKGTDAPKEVAFEDRLFRITAPLINPDPTFYDNFFSPKSEQTPFFSLFQKQKLGNMKPDEPILDGHIYFLAGYQELWNAEDIVHDLKWSTREIDREHLKVFFKQLCLQCAAEAINDGATKIHWNFSHPLAFTERDRGFFELIWKDVGLVCEGATGVSQQVVIPAQSESVVTANFFANQPAIDGFAIGAICIDIGGETSDISIWQDNKLYWQTSLRFAARHIFLDLLKENPEFLEHFGVDSSDIELLKEASNNTFYAQADALIHDKGKEWLKKLPVVGAAPTIQPFLQLISLGVAGLLYYVGLLLDYLSQSTADFEPKIPNIYIGGNGCKILHWMAAGSFDGNAIASRSKKHLKHVIREASEFDSDNNSDIVISGSPKKEAAYGLVAAAKKLTNLKKAQLNILAGETFTENGVDYKWTEILTAERLKKRLSIYENQLEQIENFIESFNAGLGAEIKMPIALNETLRGAIFGKLKGIFQDFSDAEPEDISVEPLFILALKALLEVKTQRWKNVKK